MGSKWKSVKMALGLRACSITFPDPEALDASNSLPELPPPTSSIASTAPAFISFKAACCICLEIMKPGPGHALFTAECSHTFHFSCIASSVRMGNLACPVCRAKWKEVPWRDLTEDQKIDQRTDALEPRSSLWIRPDIAEEQRRPGPRADILGENIIGRQRQRQISLLEPSFYNDDEPLIRPITRVSGLSEPNVQETEHAHVQKLIENDPSGQTAHLGSVDAGSVNGVDLESRKLQIILYPEVSVVAASEALGSFTVLVHLKAPSQRREMHVERETMRSTKLFPLDCNYQVPLDLVTVLDVSASMAGTKLALLKRAMGFVIQSLRSSDRLSVVVFSTSARRIFPLQQMGEVGKWKALQAINSLVSSGGTNIAEGLRKGTKVLEDRREQNPVSSIILLSDGHDTYNMTRRQFPCHLARGVGHLKPGSLRHSSRYGYMQIPVHAFGFGADHDAAKMHAISQASGGSFSFIQTEAVVQDAFAQCIAGLLSMAIQNLQLKVNCVSSGVQINKFEAGIYESSIQGSTTHGSVKLGDLYADEERDVLVELKLPSLSQAQCDCSTPVLQVVCTYTDSLTQESVETSAYDLFISRPLIVDKSQEVTSLEVDRQRNRLHVAKMIAEAGSLADRGEISAAQEMLQSAKASLRDSLSAKAGDQLCSLLERELSEIQMRMANMFLYERSGRPYLLSVQSSHSQQRATTRGQGPGISVNNHSQEYQTPYMVDVVLQSQTMQTLISPNASSSSDEKGQARRRRKDNTKAGFLWSQ